MRLLDRYIIKSFLVNYLLALGVLIGMYILLDLIVNFNDFTKGASPLAAAAATMPATSAYRILADMVDFYSYQLLVIFQQVSGVIPLMAAGFTMVRMTRHHELTAMLASGVSLYRVAAPIVLVSIGISALHVVNQEFVISQPFVIEKLLRRHDEVNVAGAKAEPLMFIKDSDNSLLSARSYDPVKKLMKDVFIVQRNEWGMPTGHIVAGEAQWAVSPVDGRECWVMQHVLEADDTPGKSVTEHVAQPAEVKYYETGLTPEQVDLILSKKAVDYLSSEKVHELAKFSPAINQPMLYKIMHLRFTQPLMNIVMLLIGIPFLLTREPNRLVVNMFYCTAVSGFVFIATFVIFQMAGTQLNPLLAAWLPVLIFGPFALVMTDLIRT